MPRYLLDTNTISEASTRDTHPNVRRRMRAHLDEVATAAPVYQELLFGVYRLPASRRRRDLEQAIRRIIPGTLPVLPYDADAAAWHAAERARLVVLGRTPPFVDAQIAAIAVVNGLILVTRNVRDFQQFRDLQVENWFE